MKKVKISFDFDETLDRLDVQNYCIYLKSKGIEIYVTTSRCTEEYFLKLLTEICLNYVKC